MSTVRIRPRSAAVVDPELARHATVDLPMAPSLPHPRMPKALAEAWTTVTSLRPPAEPDRVIIMTLAPAYAEPR